MIEGFAGIHQPSMEKGSLSVTTAHCREETDREREREGLNLHFMVYMFLPVSQSLSNLRQPFLDIGSRPLHIHTPSVSLMLM